jgi:hypothetical protein
MNNAATKITPKFSINRVLKAEVVATQLAIDTAKVARGNLEASLKVHQFKDEPCPESKYLAGFLMILAIVIMFVVGNYYG